MTKSNRVAVNRPPNYANGFAPRDGEPLFPELWRGCVGAWAPGLGPSGLTLQDWSPYKNHGTLTNMDAGADWVASQGQYALDFDGSNDYIACPSTSVSGNRWTVALWAMYRSTATLQAFWTQYTSGASGRSFLAINYDRASGSLSANQLAFGTIGTGQSLGTGTASLSANRWYHIAVRAAGSEISLWVDGVQTATAAYLISIESTPIVFGRLGNVATFHLDGMIDDARAYNYAISESHIKSLASRRGIAYEMAPRRRRGTETAAAARRNAMFGAYAF